MASASIGVQVASRATASCDRTVQHDLARPGDPDQTRGEVHRGPDDRVGAVGPAPDAAGDNLAAAMPT